ncbi:PstS family phosphate ABC transporter substrate-binding protein [uncultured Demequina sp.]|uniref:PstS family phosphate ABC transporter substrate-binding protein n=1 Tax=uncultured Demequina sp. TaxID=693499 RepID=UPI00345BA078
MHDRGLALLERLALTGDQGLDHELVRDLRAVEGHGRDTVLAERDGGQTLDRVDGLAVDGVVPDFDTISDGDYPISRPLYFYVKNAHIGVVPGIDGYVAEFTSESAWGPDGYLVDKGLIPLPDAARKETGMAANDLSKLVM